MDSILAKVVTQLVACYAPVLVTITFAGVIVGLVLEAFTYGK